MIEYSLEELLVLLKNNIKVISITTILITIVVAIYTFFFITPMYQSSTDIFVTQTSEENISVSQQDINTSISLINTYGDIIKKDFILEPVIEELDLPMSTGTLRENLNVQTSGDSQVFSIVVQDENPYQAADIANTTTEIFQEKIYDIMNVDNVTILTAGTPNTNPASPNKPINIAVGVLLGLMVGVGIVFLRELTDKRIKTERFITEQLGITVLGSVKETNKADLVTVTVRAPYEDEEFNYMPRVHRKRVR